jgi:hypothetical protein
LWETGCWCGYLKPLAADIKIKMPGGVNF